MRTKSCYRCKYRRGVEPLGSFTNTEWPEIERTIKERIKEAEAYNIPFIYDGESGLDDFLADIAQSQRCI